jgi:hypothetical protein
MPILVAALLCHIDWSFQMTIYVMINIVNSSPPIDFLLFSYCVVLTAVASDNKDI